MDFETFEKILKQSLLEFEEKDKIGFIGFMGSLKMENDLDFIITPTPGVKKGEFLKIMCNFLELLEKNLKKQKSRLIAFSYSTLQEEVEYLSKRSKNDIFLHLLTFVDLVPKNQEVVNSILKSNKIYFGDKKNLGIQEETNKDYYYNYLFFIDCLSSNYPKYLETRKIQERVSYIFKHNGEEIHLSNKSNKEILFECCDFLDKISK